jgi:hypothetical protein
VPAFGNWEPLVLGFFWEPVVGDLVGGGFTEHKNRVQHRDTIHGTRCRLPQEKKNTQNTPWSSSFVVLFSLLRLPLLFLDLFAFPSRALTTCILFCSKSLARIRFSVFSIFIYFLVGFFLLITDSAVQEAFFSAGFDTD